VGTFVAAAVVAYGTYRLVGWAWNSWIVSRSEDSADHHHEEEAHVVRDIIVSGTPQVNNRRQKWRLRRQRIARCREETVNALNDFLPALRRRIEELTDCSEETKALKDLRKATTNDDRRDKEREIWNAIKVKAMTRMISVAYAHTILFLLLTVQVHSMGGKLFEEQAHSLEAASSLGVGSAASHRMTSYQESHRIVLTKTYDFFFDQGIILLVAAVEKAVDIVVADWDVTHHSSVHTSRDMIDTAIKEICDNMEGRKGRPSRRPRSILRFVGPPEQSFDSAVSDDLAQTILDETLDVLESPVFEDAQRDCLATTLDLMREESWSKIFLVTDLPHHASSPWTEKPLATVISKLKSTSNSFFEPPPEGTQSTFKHSVPSVNIYLPSLERIPTVVELGDISFN
jgi:hypothetical protein